MDGMKKREDGRMVRFHAKSYASALGLALCALSGLTQAQTTTTWQRIASEGQTFMVSGTQTVRYGAGTSWIQRTVTGSGQCTNAFFGQDPIQWTVKSCEVSTSTPPPTQTTWQRIASEGQTFTVSGTQTVRYGAGTSWIERTMTGSGQCTNAFFGRDPIQGTAKSCEVSTGTPPPTQTTWQRIASEGQTFTVSGTQTVRYGAGTSWIERTMTGSGQCTNAFFGQDPIQGTAKTCEVSTQPPPQPSAYTLTVTKTGSGTVMSNSGINCGTSCSVTLSAGTIVTLTAQPVQGYMFGGWSGACAGLAATCTVTLNSARAVGANFTSTVSVTDASNILYSGHSLLGRFMAESLRGIATGSARTMNYTMQKYLGSPISLRGAKKDGSSYNFTGYQKDQFYSSVKGDWAGRVTGVNVINELRNPQLLNAGQRYDTLLITENHAIVGMLGWEGTVQTLRHYHELAHSANPQLQTYFQHSWWDVSNKANPTDWIRYERDAAPVWQCVATRINKSLEAEGRSDRIKSIPAASALAELIERATIGNVAGITRGSIQETVNAIFAKDNVHFSNDDAFTLGDYYVGLIEYAFIYKQNPSGAWYPSTITAQQAASLQNIAWDFYSNYATRFPERTVEQCSAYMTQSFCSRYASYSLTLSSDKHTNSDKCLRDFSQSSNDPNAFYTNPFYYNPATEAAYWYPAAP